MKRIFVLSVLLLLPSSLWGQTQKLTNEEQQLVGLGGKGGNSHAPGEWGELDSLPMLIKRTAVLLYRLTR